MPTRDLQIFYFIGSDERSVSAQSGDSLEKLGLKDGGIIEFDVVFGRDYLVSQMPGSFKVFDEIENVSLWCFHYLIIVLDCRFKSTPSSLYG